MNEYRIYQKVKTPAHFSPNKHFEYDGFKITPFGADKWRIGAHTISKTIEANDAQEAIDAFRNTTQIFLDMLFIISQCAFEFVGKSFAVNKLNDNSENLIYFYYANDVEPVGMPVNNSCLTDLKRLSAIKRKAALSYFREITNARTPVARLAILIITLEALVDEMKEIKKCDNCQFVLRQYSTTDKTKIKKILGEEIYKSLYGNGGLRNKLIHGYPVPESKAVKILDPLYEKILNHIKQEFQLSSVQKIEAAPRAYDLYESEAYFLEKNYTTIDLNELEQNHKKGGVPKISANGIANY